jgi:hypothetical protein
LGLGTRAARWLRRPAWLRIPKLKSPLKMAEHLKSNPKSNVVPKSVPRMPAAVAAALSRAAMVFSPVLRAPWLRGLVTVIIPVVMLSVFAIGIVYVRLLQGPMSIHVFARAIERGINAELAGLTARIDDAQLTFSRSGKFELRIINMRFLSDEQETVASAPLAAVELSGEALRSFRFVPERVDLIEPHVALLYSRETGVSLSLASDRDEAARGDPATPNAKAETSDVQTDPTRDAGALIMAPLPEHIVAQTRPKPVLPKSLQRIDLARLLARSNANARHGDDASSYLKKFGLRDATVTVDYAGKLTEWSVPVLDIDLAHKSKSSVISGTARVDSARGPWQLDFRTDDSEKTKELKLRASIRDLVPSALGQALKEFSLLETFNMPVSAEATFDFSTSGVFKAAAAAFELSKGDFRLPGVAAPFGIDSGAMQITYDAASLALTLAPSTLIWGDSRMTIRGAMQGAQGADSNPEWRFALASGEGSQIASEFGLDPVAIDEWTANGRIVPNLGLFELAGVTLKAGDAEITAQGEMRTGEQVSSAKLTGASSAMPLSTLKTLWPRGVAEGARRYVGENVTSGQPKSGTFSYLSGSYLEGAGNDSVSSRVSAAFEADNIRMTAKQGVAQAEVPRMLVRIENDALEIAVPDAVIVSPSGKKIPVKAGQLLAADMFGSAPQASLQLKSITPIAPVLEILAKAGAVEKTIGDIPLEAIEGKADVALSAKFPLVENLNFRNVAYVGRVQINDGKIKQKVKGLDLTGGSFVIDATEALVQGKGDVLVNGVAFKIEGQRKTDEEPDKQVPLKITANLDNSDRTTLGLDINHLVQGEMPIEVSVAETLEGPPKIHVKATLDNAELGLHDIAWVKPPGRQATAQFDVGKGKTTPLELQNFRLTGENVAIEGWMAIDDSNEVREFHFPDFSLNVVSRLDVSGKLATNKVWKIKAKGATFDGRDMFRNLVSFTANHNRIRPLRPSAGLDLEAELGTVLGHADVNLRNAVLKLSDRDDKLTSLKVDGTLDGGQPLKVLLRAPKGQNRTVYADTTDGGQAFRLIGFYPNMQGGRARLEINIDGKGDAERTGILHVDDFKVLGDAVVAEVLSSAPGGAPSQSLGTTPDAVSVGGSKKVAREVFVFDVLRVPFSAGHGQFVMEDSALRGPVLGATVTGKIDHVQKRLSLGGTYIPMQGINSALCGIPLVGQILTGAKCEGVLGITYAVQGSLDNPQVIVNPFSIVAPGIFRDIFQMTNPNQSVQARDEGRVVPPAEQRVRASSSVTTGGEPTRAAKKAARPKAVDTDGWSSTSTPAQN